MVLVNQSLQQDPEKRTTEKHQKVLVVVSEIKNYKIMLNKSFSQMSSIKKLSIGVLFRLMIDLIDLLVQFILE